jgi:hypothetical protein
MSSATVTSGGTAGPKFDLNTDLWVAGQFRFNGTLDSNPDHYVILNQLQQRTESGESGGKPPGFGFMIGGSRLRIRTTGDPNPITTSHQPLVIQWEESVDLPQNVWRHFVYRVKPHWTNGEIDFWLEGTLILSVTGICCAYNDTAANSKPRFKHGLYQWPVPFTHVVEFANVEAGPASLFARVATPLALPSF